MCPIIPSDHLSTRIGGWLCLSQGWLCLPYSILILLGDRTVKIDLYPYVYSRFVPISGEHLTRSRCKSDPVMAGVSALYNQKIILLLPMASVILSSNKTALGGVETTQYKQYWLLKKKKILVLHCRHDCAHRTRVWIRLFFPKHSHPPTQVQNTQSEHTHTQIHKERATQSTLPPPGSPVRLLFYAVSWQCGCAKPVTQTLAGPLQTPTHHLGVVLRCPREMSVGENRACPDG